MPRKAAEPVIEPEAEAAEFEIIVKVRGEIKARIEELRPAAEEYAKLLAADRALSGEVNRGGRPRST